MKARFLTLGLLAAFIAGCGGASSAQLEPDDVATVRSIHIKRSLFDAQMTLARAAIEAQGNEFPSPGTGEHEQIKAQAMAQLVQAAAREYYAGELGIQVTDKQVSQRLAQLKKQLFGGDEKKYRAELQKQHLTEDELRSRIKTVLISERVAEKLSAELQVTPEEIDAYYQANELQYTKEERDVRLILVGKGKKELADRIHDQLRSGASFAALAKRYSQDPGSKDKGGKFTAVKADVVPKFGEVAFALKKGELSEPFETPEYGWFIVRAESAPRVKKTPRKDVAAEIRAQLMQQKRTTALNEWLETAAKKVCESGAISYQPGYVPNPDPCLQFTATPPTDSDF